MSDLQAAPTAAANPPAQARAARLKSSSASRRSSNINRGVSVVEIAARVGVGTAEPAERPHHRARARSPSPIPLSLHGGGAAPSCPPCAAARGGGPCEAWWRGRSPKVTLVGGCSRPSRPGNPRKGLKHSIRARVRRNSGRPSQSAVRSARRRRPRREAFSRVSRRTPFRAGPPPRTQRFETR